MARTNRDQAIKKFKSGIVSVEESDSHTKVMVYGKNGKGKTRFAGTAPDAILLDVNERGTKSIRSYKGVEVRPIRLWEELTWAYWFLREGNHNYKSVVVDTLTQAQKLCMRAVMNEQEDRDPNRPPSTPDRRSWGQMTELMRPIIYNFRNLPMHVVFVCQERVDKGSDDDEESEIKARYVPDLSPGVRGDAMSAVDIMGRVFRRPRRVGKGKAEKIVWETRMLVGDHEDYETKDRTGQLGYIVRNPTMPKFIAASNNLEEE